MTRRAAIKNSEEHTFSAAGDNRPVLWSDTQDDVFQWQADECPRYPLSSAQASAKELACPWETSRGAKEHVDA